jgi:hypothetical protein
MWENPTPYECDLLTGNFCVHQTMGFLAYPTAIFADKPVHCMLHMLPLRSQRKIVLDNIYIPLSSSQPAPCTMYNMHEHGWQGRLHESFSYVHNILSTPS